VVPTERSPEIAPEVWDRVQARLDAIERRYDVTILHAVESGSRAWGFPSPDSDYDVRFIYRHPAAWYLSVIEGRDVVEEGVDEFGMDVSGWDIRKALRLLLKSNPPLYEWLSAPIVYRSDAAFARRLRALCERLFDRRTLAYHYRSIALNQRRDNWQGRDLVKLKKYFYALRPLAAVGWLRAHPEGIPPMNLASLLDGISVPASVRAAIDALLERKRVTSELGEGPPIPVLEQWISDQLDAAEAYCAHLPSAPPARAAVDDFFRELLDVARGDEFEGAAR
jgi:predicted nucleotidyltransferase